MKTTYEELQEQLETSRREFRSADITMQNLEAKCEKLAAENAGLNKFIIQSCYVFDGEQHEISDAYICATDGGMPETKETESFLAEVRAQARTDFIDRIEWIIRNECNPEKTETIINELQAFAAQIRKGVQS